MSSVYIHKIHFSKFEKCYFVAFFNGDREEDVTVTSFETSFTRRSFK